MVLRKGKADASLVNGGGIRRSAESTDDHWAFLEEIEAPMWVDLTLETQFMDQDIDDAWFRLSHPIHQMSSRRVKSTFPDFVDENLVPTKLRFRTTKLPDSVSRSRGKHYKSRKWAGSDHVSMDKSHPIRELGAKEVAGPSASGSNSSSTVTTDSSLRKPLSNSEVPKHNSGLKSGSTVVTSTSSSVVSKCTGLKPKSGFRGPKNTSDAKLSTSEVSCSDSNFRGRSYTKYSGRGEIMSRNLPRDRKSSSSKSSVGSSYSLGCKLEGINSIAILEDMKNMEGKDASRSVSVSKISGRQIPDTSSNSKPQKKAIGVKVICQEPKSKGLGSNLSRKPLGLLNESRPVKDRVLTKPRPSVAAGKLNSVAGSNYKNTSERKFQKPKSLRNQAWI